MVIGQHHAAMVTEQVPLPEEIGSILVCWGFWVLSVVLAQPASTPPPWHHGGVTQSHLKDVCIVLTGPAETVRWYLPQLISYAALLKLFWEQHDPAQGMRQGGDVGTQYRSVIFYGDETQQVIAQQSLAAYQQAMMASGDSRAITTRILPLAPFYYAEDYHQQYLEKNPEGYCGLGGIGVCLPPSLNR